MKRPALVYYIYTAVFTVAGNVEQAIKNTLKYGWLFAGKSTTLVVANGYLLLRCKAMVKCL